VQIAVGVVAGDECALVFVVAADTAHRAGERDLLDRFGWRRDGSERPAPPA
jgi:hypothetical protein